MHLNRQIILLFFLSSIVNPSSIVNIVNRQGRDGANRQGQPVEGSSGPKAQRSKGPKVKPGPTVGTTTGARPKGIYVSNATAPQKINKNILGERSQQAGAAVSLN
jgi:hypothetical protein